jgi:hypothetical protein
MVLNPSVWRAFRCVHKPLSESSNLFVALPLPQHGELCRNMQVTELQCLSMKCKKFNLFDLVILANL